MKKILSHLFEGKTFSKAESNEILTDIASGKYNNSQMAAFMTAYCMRSITVEELEGFRDAMLELCFKVERLRAREGIGDLICRHGCRHGYGGGRQRKNQENCTNGSRHRQPLWKAHPDLCFSSRDPVSLARKIWVFENQVRSNRHADIAQWRLSQRFPLGAIDKHLRPWFCIDLNDNVEGDHRRCRIIRFDDMRQDLVHVLVPVFERLIPRRQYKCYRGGPDQLVVNIDIHRCRRTHGKSSRFKRRDRRNA